MGGSVRLTMNAHLKTAHNEKLRWQTISCYTLYSLNITLCCNETLISYVYRNAIRGDNASLRFQCRERNGKLTAVERVTSSTVVLKRRSCILSHTIGSLTVAMASLFRYKLLYFVQFAGYGVISPYMPIFFETLSMSKSQIGILSMIPNVCCFLVGPIFSFIGKQ